MSRREEEPRGEVTAYLAFGSNLGDRRHNLERGLELLQCGGRLVRRSQVYETKAWGPLPQPDYLNLAIALETELGPRRLLRSALHVEAQMGRRRGIRYSPRTLDIDLLFYGQTVLDEPELTLPHPRLAERLFVLEPLCEIAPSLVHPASGVTVAALLADLRRRSPLPPP